MEELKYRLLSRIKKLDSKYQVEILRRLDNLVSVYPFNEYEFMIANLLSLNAISMDDYYDLRDEYHSKNVFLYVFEINAPRGFGEAWAQGHLKEICLDFVKPSKKLDKNYSGQYDFLMDNQIKIEVKASRAVDANSKKPLSVKALYSDSKLSWDMNFQQIKPICCDVFIWIGVWRDRIRYWVLSSNEVESNRYYSGGQHRGNEGEGQLHLKDTNVLEFAKFEVEPSKIQSAVSLAYKRQIKYLNK